VLTDTEAENIRASLARGISGPIVVKWLELLLHDRDERKRSLSGNGGRPLARWEMVSAGPAGKKDPQELTQRLRVPGGWLYRTIVKGAESREYAVSVCFVAER
jgi:hypothetical protein